MGTCCTVTFAEGYLKPERRAAEREHHVRLSLDLCGLSDVASTRVGDPDGVGQARGISGGQRRRLSVAKAIVSGPSVCFLDEPTSGLSATDAARIVETLRKLSRCFDMSFVAVIHAPRATVFAAFSHLVLLGPGGKCVYNNAPTTGCCGSSGPATTTTTMLGVQQEETLTMPEAVGAHFAKHGFPTPKGVPIAEWALDVVTPTASEQRVHVLPTDREEEEDKRELEEEKVKKEEEIDEEEGARASTSIFLVDRLFAAYETELAPLVRLRVDEVDVSPGLSPRQIISRRHNPVASHPERRRVVGFVQQLYVLFTRDARLISRDTGTLAAIFGNAAVLGLLVGLVYLDVRNKEGTPEQATQYQLSFVFMVIIVAALAANNAAPVYVAERAVFVREREEEMYGALPYVVSKAAAWTAVNGIANVLFVTMTYFMVRLSTSEN